MSPHASLATAAGSARPAPAVPASAAGMAEARLVPLGPGLTVLAFDDAGGAGRARLTGEVDGRRLPPPLVATSLDLVGGGRRHAILVGRPLADLLDRPLLILLDGAPAAAVGAGWLQPPVGDAAALAAGLTGAARRRLLKLVLTTGASLFGPADPTAFAAAAARILDLCAPEAGALVAVAALGPGQRVLSVRAPAGLDPGLPNLAVALSPTGATTLRRLSATIERRPDGHLLHLLLPQPVPERAELVLLGPRPLRVPAATVVPRPLPAWAARRDPAARAWAVARAAEAARAGDAPAGLLRELRGGAVAPAFDLRHLSASPAGLLFALDLRDPDGLVRAVVVERGGASATIAPTLRLDGGGTLAGLLPLRGEGPCRVRLLRHSGALGPAEEATPPPYDGAVPPGFAQAREEAAAQGRLPARDPLDALARAQLALVAEPVRAVAQAFGSRPARLRLGVVTTLGEDPDALRALAATAARERGARGLELVCVAPEGQAAAAARAIAAVAAATFGLALRVVAVPPGTGAAGRLRAGLAHAGAPAVLALGAGVLPAREGWLHFWAARAARGPVAAPIRDHDGAAEPAGPCADAVGLGQGAAARLLAEPCGHPDPAVVLAAAFGGRLARAPERAAFVRYGAAPRPTAFEAALRARVLERLAGGAA